MSVASRAFGAPPSASVYAENVGMLAGHGFSCIPIQPGKKRPYGGLAKWERFCQAAPSPSAIDYFSRMPDAGIGGALGGAVYENILIGIDLDATGDALDTLRSSVPFSPMVKMGARGETRFFLAPPSLKSASHSRPIEGSKKREMLLEFLADGCQTVLPPTMHPDTQTPYVWLAGPVPVASLPVLTQDDLDRVMDTLDGLGCTQESEPGNVVALRPSRDEDDDAASYYFNEIKSRALSDPDSWVHDLGLYGLRRRGGGFKAVPTWRPSNSGNPPERRKLNLSIHRSGIIDFGDGRKGYSAADLVSAAKGIDYTAACDWLYHRTGMKAEADAAIDRVAIWANHELRRLTKKDVAPRVKAMVAKAGVILEPLPLHDPVTGEILNGSTTVSASGTIWERHGEPSPFAEPFWFIKGLVPTKGNFLIAGVSTAGKTFVEISLAVSLATGASFMGLPIRQRCGSIFVVGEGRATIRKRLTAAVKGLCGDDDIAKLPISFTEASLTPSARAATIAALKAEKARMKDVLGIDLGVVFVDTLAACFEFEDENSSSEATKSMNVLKDIGRELECLVIATAHHGKNEASGVRGSSAFTGSADDILTVIVEKDGSDNVIQRQVRVAKTRDGEIGKRFPFELVPISIGVDRDGDAIISAYVRATGDAAIVRVPGAERERLPQAVRAYLAALSVTQAEAIEIQPFGFEGASVKAVPREVVRREFYASYPADGDTEAKRHETKRKAFNKGEAGLIEKSKIATRDIGLITFVWKI